MAACVYPRFSARLRRLRRERMEGAGLCAQLCDAGYSIEPGQYTMVESGEDLPQDARALILAISACLRLTAQQEHELTMALAQDLVADKLGIERMVVILNCAETD